MKIFYDEKLAQMYLDENIKNIENVKISDNNVNISFYNGDVVNVYYDLAGVVLSKKEENK